MNTFYFRGFWAVCLILLFSCTENQPDIPEGFEIHPEFTLEEVAAEPLVFDPVDMEFDEAGRAFVLEMPGYPLRDENSRLVLLLDEDKDGVFDKRQIYADSLNLASSFIPYKGGMLVASPPYLLFLSDENGDNVADKREILMEGFKVGNLQHNYNGLTYGLDNWIYSANGGNSGAPYFAGDSENPLVLRDDDFRFKLEEALLEKVGQSSGGFELAFDNWGRMYETHNLEHVSQLVFEGKYIDGLPVSTSHSLKNISDHEENGLARIYPIGAQDTRVNHPEQSGYFSGSCGISFYGGGQFPQGYNDNIFVADVVLNLIHMDVLSSEGSHSKASRNREKAEFLASSDRSFRPVNMTTGPDGGLYILDMHRAVIEHPEWIPDEIEKEMDLGEGKDQGRIYRVFPKKMKPKPFKGLDRTNTPSLLKALQSPNQWERMTAQRLLVEIGGDESTEALKEMLVNSAHEFARLHALWTLEGLGKITEDILRKGLNDASPGVRENAIKVAELYHNSSPEIGQSLLALCTDEIPRVRLAAALAIGTFPQAYLESHFEDIFSAFQKMLAKEDSDIWISLAAASAMQHQALAFSRQLIDQANGEMNEQYKESLLTLCRLIGKRQNIPEAEVLLNKLAANQDLLLRDKQLLLNAIVSNWGINPSDKKMTSRGMASIEKLEESLDPAMLASCGTFRKTLGLGVSASLKKQLLDAKTDVLDETQSLQKRLELLKLLALEPFEKRERSLYSLLDNRIPQALQDEAMQQLWLSNNQEVAANLLKLWPELGPKSRKNAGDILLYKRDNHELLLTAFENKRINLGELNLDLERRRVLLWSENEAIKQRAEKLFSDAGVVQRKEAIEKMRPALTLKGNREKGKKQFQLLCASCHQYANQGLDVGPVLTEIHRKSKASLMHDILDPNAAVDPKYLNHQVLTNDGNIYIGIIHVESSDDLVLKMNGGQEKRIAKKEIKKLSTTGLSLMPEGLENGMSQEDFANLLAYLLQES